MAAEKAGADVQFMNTMNMNITHCRGCGACSASRDKGGQIKCILKDDYLTMENAVLDADGIILVAPVYSLAPTGQLKTLSTVSALPMTFLQRQLSRRNVSLRARPAMSC